MKLRCLAVDDEPLGLSILADDLQQIPMIDLIGTFTNPFAAMELMQQGKVDLLFLDIQLPTLLGTDFVRALVDPPLIIFTTAYEQYALEGYELNVLDYLLKPIRFERLLRACTKAHNVLLQKPKTVDEVPADSFFFVNTEYKETKIYYHDILYIEGLKDYVKIFVASQPGKPIMTRLNVKAMEAKLDSVRFCRVHQSYIVPISRITSFHKTKILLGNITIPVGERYAEAFLTIYRNA